MIGNSVEENIKPKIASRNLPDLMSVNPNAYAAGLAEQGVLADVGHTAAWGKLLPSLKVGLDDAERQALRHRRRRRRHPDVLQQEHVRAGRHRPAADQFQPVPRRLRAPEEGRLHADRAGTAASPTCSATAPFSFGFANNVVAAHARLEGAHRRRHAERWPTPPAPTSSPRSSWWRSAATRSRTSCSTGYDEGIDAVHRRQGRDGVPGHLGGRPA